METADFFKYPTGDVDATPREEPFLGQCTAAEWDLIRAHSTTVTVPAGGTVIAPGSTARALLVVLDGQVEVERVAGRRRRRLAVLGVGAVLGELGFLDGKPANALVRARVSCSFLSLPLESFDRLAAQHPELALYLLFDTGRMVARRLRVLDATGL